MSAATPPPREPQPVEHDPYEALENTGAALRWLLLWGGFVALGVLIGYGLDHTLR